MPLRFAVRAGSLLRLATWPYFPDQNKPRFLLVTRRLGPGSVRVAPFSRDKNQRLSHPESYITIAKNTHPSLYYGPSHPHGILLMPCKLCLAHYDGSPIFRTVEINTLDEIVTARGIATEIVTSGFCSSDDWKRILSSIPNKHLGEFSSDP